MRREFAVLGMVICIAAGFGLGWFIPPLLTAEPAEGKTLLEEIQDRGYIYVGTDEPWPPFEIFNVTADEWQGFDIDLSAMIAAHLNVSLEMTDMDFDLLIGACKAGTIDMIAAAMMVTPTRAEQLAHSVPYIRVTEVVIVKTASTINITSLDEITAYIVGVQSGTTQHDTLLDLGMTEGVDLLVYPKADVLMAALDAGTINAAFVDEPVFTVYAKTYAFKSIFTVPAEPTALWCRWEEPELMKEINTVILNAFGDGTMDLLIEKWFG